MFVFLPSGGTNSADILLKRCSAVRRNKASIPSANRATSLLPGARPRVPLKTLRPFFSRTRVRFLGRTIDAIHCLSVNWIESEGVKKDPGPQGRRRTLQAHTHFEENQEGHVKDSQESDQDQEVFDKTTHSQSEIQDLETSRRDFQYLGFSTHLAAPELVPGRVGEEAGMGSGWANS